MAPRVAFFPDSFHEINGVANTARRIETYARNRGLPFLSAHAGDKTRCEERDSVTTLELKRSSVRIKLDRDLSFDLLFWRYLDLVLETTRHFRPDLIHVTGPSDIGLLGVIAARKLKVPLVMSWHTNLHEFAALRGGNLLRFLPANATGKVSGLIERAVLSAALTYYRLGRVLLGSNPELVALLEAGTGRPTYLLRRGVDTEMFSPHHRSLQSEITTIGYVGRLTPEKNVRLLAQLERALLDNGISRFRFLIVGDGNERQWLERQMAKAGFTGVLRGEALARAYANIDIFVFPSTSDAFPNVVLEAMASGTAPVVMNQGGPKFILENGVSGFVVSNLDEFVGAVAKLISDADLLRETRRQARIRACAASWDRVCEDLYDAYIACLDRGSHREQELTTKTQRHKVF